MADKKEDDKPSAAAPRPAANLRYVDRPDCLETFADSISGVTFDGQTLHLEFCVTRMDDMKPNTPASGRRYPVCRLVLAPVTAVELINHMQQVGAALTKAGIVKANPPAGEKNDPRPPRPPVNIKKPLYMHCEGGGGLL